MARPEFGDPFLRAYVALGLLLLPVIVLLAEQYPSYDERMRAAAGAPQLKPLPTVVEMQAQLAREAPEMRGLQWELAYAPLEEPRTGIAQVYDLRDADAVRYRLVVIRHDIACGVCRDLLAGLVVDVVQRRWAQMLLFEEFERKGAPLDARPFVEQFVGEDVEAGYVLGDDVDGVTGASLSVKGFILRIQEAGQWLAQHPVAQTVVAEAQP